MTKIAISTFDSASLAAARRAGESRSYIWKRIRDQFGIPANLKLGMDTFRKLFVKGTDPRQYLIADATGRFSHSADDSISGVSLAVSPTALWPFGQAATEASVAVDSDDSRFAMYDPGGNGDTGWVRVPLSAVVDALQNSDEAEHGVTPPAGMPLPLGDDAFVVDNDTDSVYFRA